MQKGRFSFTLLFLLVVFAAVGQELSWQWASFATSKTVNRVFSSFTCGFQNDIYAVCEYDSLICAGDTVIRHPEIYGENSANSVVINYNTNGEFIDLVDLHTLPGSMIFDTRPGVDHNGNLTISCSFSKRLFIQDTIINHCNTPYIDLQDILVVQLNKAREINWARTIGGTLSDQVFGHVIDQNGDIYVLSDHVAGGSPPTVIDFFQQDTVITNVGFTALSKLSQDGIFEWRIDFIGDMSTFRMFLGKDNFLYFWGTARSHFTINNDTTIYSGNSSLYLPFVCRIRDDGSVLMAEFADFPVNPGGLSVDINGDYCLSAYVYDTLIIGKDTTIVPENLSYRLIGKFDSLYRPVWYHVVPTVANQQMGGLGFALDGEDLVFASYSNRDVQIGDTVIDIPAGRTAFVGIFDPAGNLKTITVSSIYGEFPAANIQLDKCGNLLLAGNLRGSIYLENDTASSYWSIRFDATLAKIKRYEPGLLNIGPDTNACEEYLLTAPPGYSEYSLNGSLTNQNSFLIGETGSYVIGCSDNGCWVYDTISIGIHPGITLEIGNDTTLYTSDSIMFVVPAVYDSIRWFDGTGSFEKVIYGKDYLPGKIPVWANVFSGPCSASDTLMLEIRSNFGIEEPEDHPVIVYPIHS